VYFTSVADLVDADAARTLEGIVNYPGVVDDSRDDRPDGSPPRHPQQLTDLLLRTLPGSLPECRPGISSHRRR
jgi:hypothetical protein